MSNQLLELIITLVLGGGLLKGIEAVYRAYTEGKEKQRLGAAVGAKTPAEIESLTVSTMISVLESAEDRIKSLTAERETDRDYLQHKIDRLLAHIKILETKIDRLQAQNLELLKVRIEEKEDG